MRRANAALIVLPFVAASAHGEDAVIAQGLGEDITGELGRFANLDVLAPSAGAAVVPATHGEIGERLGVSHVLEGALRRAGEGFRITVGLVECAGGTQVWRERFDCPAGDLFAVQDEIVAEIAATLVPRLEKSALHAARRRPMDLATYTLTLEGFARLREGTLEADNAARALFERAIEADPTYARAHAGIALSWFNEWSCQFWECFEENARRAYVSAHQALEFDDTDARLHQILGKLHLFRRDFERASWYFDRALELCPNDTELLIEQALYDTYLGRPDVGVANAERAMKLNPHHPGYYPGLAAFALLMMGEVARAVDLWGRAEGVATVDVPAFLAVAHAHLGRLDEARALFAQYEAQFREKILFGRAPQEGEAVRWFFEQNPFREPAHIDFLAEGLRLLQAPLPGAHSAPVGPAAPARFARAGEGWIALYDGKEALFPDLKGFVDISRLLERPGEELHCLDLAERLPAEHGGDDVLDDRARAALKARIRDLQAEIAEAEDDNDIARTERLRSEFDALVRSLSEALGLGGRSRRLGSLTERARTTVTWRIRHALKRIDAAHPELGRHFANSLRTGTFCSYAPERPVAWQLSG